MKYRMLTNEEMEIFDEDFKHFMVVNGVTNEEWLAMNEDNIEKATELVELFADTVLQKVYEKIRFIEHRTSNSCMVFKLNKEIIELISINRNEDTLDLSTPESIHNALVNSSKQLSIFKTEKAYSDNRELEIHKMLEGGCVNSSKDFWNSLAKVLK